MMRHINLLPDGWKQHAVRRSVAVPRRGVDHPEYRTLAGLDIEGYGRSTWTDPMRLRFRHALAELSDAALAQAGVGRGRYYRHSTGDGQLLSIDPRIPRSVLLAGMLDGLWQQLTHLNSGKPPVEQLRVRLAFHGGDVLRDPDPLEGIATVLICRLLDAEELRACLRATTQPIAAIASAEIYGGIIRHGYPGIDPADWHQTVVTTKEGPQLAWVSVPDDRTAPQRAGVTLPDIL